MPTILVADDNSNIQKMVALAFKDEGIDVVTVGNGEAAIRKAAEVAPDLVLADIFMPVRSGYEVCEYLKQTTRLAHIPVVLLAGAFDPFDEREAQRVGADGVLKKPFVPTDPLVNLVKGLLAKSNSQVLVSVSAPAQSGTSMETKSAPAAPVAPLHLEKSPARETAPEFPSEMDTEPAVKDFSLTPSQVSAGNEGGSDPFADMLARHAEKEGEPLFQPSFQKDTQEQEPAEAIDNLTSWMTKPSASEQPVPRMEEVGFIQKSPPVNPSEKELAGRGWHIESAGATHPEEETLVEPLDRFVPAHFSEPNQPVRPAQSDSLLSTPTPPVTAFSIGGADEELSGQPSNPVDGLTEIEQLISSANPEPSKKDWQPSFPAAPAQGAQILDPTEGTPAWRSFTPMANPAVEGSTEAAPQTVPAAQEGDAAQKAGLVQEFSSPKEGGVTEETKATEENKFVEQKVGAQAEAPAEPTAKDSAPVEAAPAPAIQDHESASTVSEPVVNESQWKELEAATVEVARANLKVDDISAAQDHSVPGPSATPMDTKAVEDMVTRVVERMQPKILEVITREVLRPLVEALVRRQMEEK